MDNIKKKTLFDENKLIDVYKKTNVMFFIPGTDECIFQGSNKVILPGSGFTARKHFNITTPEITPSYNTVLGLENTVPTTTRPANPDLEKCFLFALGTDGCGRENSQVAVENYGKWIPPESLVPFRYQLDSIDITANQRNMYFGRKIINDKIAYYFKAFDSDPILIQQYIDGTPLDINIYTSTNTTEIESYVELNFKITKNDCRDFFIATTGINDARINSVSLLTAWAYEINGQIYYQDIRPLTKLNIPNEVLIDMTKGIDIIYQIYY